MLIYPQSGEVAQLPLKEAREAQRPECRYCADFAAEHADISAGGVGATGWTITIVRSERGRKFMDGAIAAGRLEVRRIEEFESSLKVLNRLAQKSRDRVPPAGVHGQGLSYASTD